MTTTAACNLKGILHTYQNHVIMLVLSAALTIVTEQMEVLEQIPHFGHAHHRTNHQIVHTKMDLLSDNQPQGFYFVKLQ